MTNDRSNEPAGGDVGLSCRNAFGEPRYRNADVACKRLGAWSQTKRRPIGVMPGLPQPAAVLRLGGPFERTTAQIGCYFAEMRRLLVHACGTAVELDAQHRAFRKLQFRIGIDGFH